MLIVKLVGKTTRRRERDKYLDELATRNNRNKGRYLNSYSGDGGR